MEDLRKLAEAATSGPWVMVPAGNKPEVMCGARSGWGSTTICRVESLNFVEDARFIAAARKAVPALLDEITALRAKVKAQENMRKSQIAYSCDLQRIIEDICCGKDIRTPETSARFHYDMAVRFRRRAAQDAGNE